MKLEISDLKEIIELAAHVVLLRHGDVSTENGNYATTDCDSMIRLDQAIADTFDLDSDDVTFENIDSLLGKIGDVFNAIEAVFSYKPVSESGRLDSIDSRLEFIERMLGAESKRFLSESEVPSPGMILIEEEPEWRPMSTAPAYKGARIEVVTHNNVVAKVTFDPEYKYLPWRFDTYHGFGADELKCWRPL